MTLIKKRDVKDYFAARRLKGGPIHIVPANKPAKTGLPKSEQPSVENAPTGFDQDFIADHSSSGVPLGSASRATASKTAKTPPAFGRESL